MGDTKNKTVSLVGRNKPYAPSPANTLPYSVLDGHEAFNCLRSIDDQVAQGKRSLHVYGLDGGTDFLPAESGLSGSATQQAPYSTQEREVARVKVELTPGNFIVPIYQVFPAGACQHSGTSGGLKWFEDDPYGELIVKAHFTGYFGGTAEVTQSYDTPVSPHDNGAMKDGLGWQDLSTIKGNIILPPDFFGDPDVQSDFSEKTICELTFLEKGSPRVASCDIVEMPIYHSHHHQSSSQVSVNAYTENGALPQKVIGIYPWTKAPDGTTYDEDRFGITQALHAKENQNKTLGPWIYNFTCYTNNRSITGVDSSIPDPVSITASTWKCLWNTSQQDYDRSREGILIPGTYSQRHDISEQEQILKGWDAQIPVRVKAYLTMNSTTTAYIRLQSNEFCAFDYAWTTPAAATPGWYEMSCYLPADLYPVNHNRDNPNAPMRNLLQVFFKTETGSLSVYYLSIVAETRL